MSTADLRSVNILNESCINTSSDEEPGEIISIREDDLDDASPMRRALIHECELWGRDDDRVLIEVCEELPFYCIMC